MIQLYVCWTSSPIRSPDKVSPLYACVIVKGGEFNSWAIEEVFPTQTIFFSHYGVEQGFDSVYTTLVHEIGHTVGLLHTFQDTDLFGEGTAGSFAEDIECGVGSGASIDSLGDCSCPDGTTSCTGSGCRTFEYDDGSIEHYWQIDECETGCECGVVTDPCGSDSGGASLDDYGGNVCMCPTNTKCTGSGCIENGSEQSFWDPGTCGEAGCSCVALCSSCIPTEAKAQFTGDFISDTKPTLTTGKVLGFD